MVVSPVTPMDLEWIVRVLAVRRGPLVEHAPVFWRPASDAAEAHRAFLEYLLTEGGARAYRTESSVLVAVPHGDGWLVDDLHVAKQRWDTDGRDLWNALSADFQGAQVRLVCPAYEQDRADFAVRAGLQVQETWWLRELDGGGGQAGVTVPLPGGSAVTVGAPPVYAPPGPILFLPAPTDPAAAIAAAVQRAPELGCAAIVVNQVAANQHLCKTLLDKGFRRHCDYFVGAIRSF